MSYSTSTSHYLLLFRHNTDTPDPTPAEMEAKMARIMAWLRDLKARGAFVATSPLEDEGRVLRAPGGTTITDGPYVESKEVVGGYVIVDAPSLDAATAIARSLPNLDRTTVEVRQMRSLTGF
jgi:hypothetical protein